MAHFMPYLVGDSLAADTRAAAEHFRFIDKNLLSTSDLVGICHHSSDLSSALGGWMVYRWTGPRWGEGKLIRDPSPDLTLGNRTWANVELLTNAAGTGRILPAVDHLRASVETGVPTVLEPKGSPLLDDPEFWRRLGLQADSVGHPRWMMTLTDIGSPLRRLIAAHGQAWETRILPRGDVPNATELARYRPVVDGVWGSAWGDLQL